MWLTRYSMLADNYTASRLRAKSLSSSITKVFTDLGWDNTFEFKVMTRIDDGEECHDHEGSGWAWLRRGEAYEEKWVSEHTAIALARCVRQ